MYKLSYLTIAPVVTVTDNHPCRVEFWNNQTDELIATATAAPGKPATVDIKRYVPWRVRVERGDVQQEEIMQLAGRNVYIEITSGALGDTLAWLPYVEEFRQLHGCHVAVSTAYNELLAPVYPDLHFIAPGTSIEGAHHVYHIGWYGDGSPNAYNPQDCRAIPLQQVASDILGLPYRELRPNYRTSAKAPLAGKYVCISTNSTMQFKHWNNTEGWQAVVNELTKLGYRVAVIGTQPTRLHGVVDCTGARDLRALGEVLQHAKLFVGLPSGLTWLAWAYQRKCVMISGMSESFCEFQQDMYRVSNPTVCGGCFNDTSVPLNPKDWMFCPRHKGTARQFECTKTVTPAMVIAQIKTALAN